MPSKEREVLSTLASSSSSFSRTHQSSSTIKFQTCPGHSNYIQAKPSLLSTQTDRHRWMMNAKYPERSVLLNLFLSPREQNHKCDLSVAGPTQGTSRPVMMESYLERLKVVPLKPVASGTIINSLCEDTFHGLHISVLHSPPNLNCLDEQPVKNMKRQLLVSERKETGEGSLHSRQLKYQTMFHGGVQIWVRHGKYQRSQYVSVSSEVETDATEISLDACDLSPPWNLETPKTQCNNFSDIYS
ncbi:hypothetical protein ACTXT7_002392 [Hymenolepis weldensis]